MRNIAAKTLVFVYGTLKKGERYHPLFFQDGDFVGADVTAEAAFTMRDVSGDPGEGDEQFYPAAFYWQGGARISGEVYSVDDTTLARLDELEEVGTLYERASVSLLGGADAQMYIHLGTPMAEGVQSPRIAFDEKTRTLGWRTHPKGGA